MGGTQRGQDVLLDITPLHRKERQYQGEDTIETRSVAWNSETIHCVLCKGSGPLLLAPEGRTPHTETTNIFCSSAKLIAENRRSLLFLQLWVIRITEFAVIDWFPVIEETAERLKLRDALP